MRDNLAAEAVVKERSQRWSIAEAGPTEIAAARLAVTTLPSSRDMISIEAGVWQGGSAARSSAPAGKGGGDFGLRGELPGVGLAKT
jgi:hypothetical protein